MMPGVNYVIYGCSSARAAPEVSLYRDWRKNIPAVINQDRVTGDNLKKQIENRTLYTCRFFLLT